MPDHFRLTFWIDEDGRWYFDLRDHSPDVSSFRQYLGEVVAGKESSGDNWTQAKMRDHLQTGLGWPPGVVNAAISATIEDRRNVP